MSVERRPYRFGPRDARGLVLGVRPSQAAIVSCTLITTVGILRATHGPGRVVVPCCDLALGLAAAFVPIRGRTLGSWLPVIATYLAAGLTGRRRVVPIPSTAAPVRRPGVFTPFEVVATEFAGRKIGAVSDRRHGTLTGVVAVSGAGFTLLDESERERIIAGWSSVLSALATSPITPARVQWVERTVPDNRRSLRERVERLIADEAESARSSTPMLRRARASYAALVESESLGAYVHECVVAVSVRNRAGWSASVRREGGQRSGAELLVAAMVSLEARLASVGFDVQGALTPSGLSAYLDRSFHDGGERPATASPWPIACETRWASFRTDALVHATYWVAEWPRSDVSSEFLLPLLAETESRRAIALVMEPMSPRRAVRRAEHARTSARADGEVRRRHGFTQSAQTARQHDAILQREEELASGHAGYRFSGYVTVSAPDTTALERECARIEQAGALARLELRRLFGNQDAAFTCSMPVGRGCG